MSDISAAAIVSRLEKEAPAELFGEWTRWGLSWTDKDKAPRDTTGARLSWASLDHCLPWSTVRQFCLESGAPVLPGIFVGSLPTHVILDIDKCVVNRQLVPAAEWLLTEFFADCYAELSQSGTGVHVLVPADKQRVLEAFGRPKRKYRQFPTPRGMLELEVFIATGYVILTGDCITPQRGKSPADCTDRLVQLADMGAVPRCRPRTVTGGLYELNATERPEAGSLDDDEVLERALAARNGERFRELYYHPEKAVLYYRGPDGDVDPSAAAHALVCMLAFWTGGDPEQIDRLFRRSAMYQFWCEHGTGRPKWDRLADHEITRALAFVGEFFTTRRGESKKRQATTLQEVIGGASELFLAEARIMTSDSQKSTSWAFWCDDHWELWCIQSLAQNKFFELAERLFGEKASELTPAACNKAIREIIMRHGRRLVASPRIFDSKLDLLPVRNGVLEIGEFLKTGNVGDIKLSRHRPENLNAGVMPVTFDPDADCPAWKEHLQRFLPDEETRRSFQMLIGACLIGAAPQYLAIHYGDGANGKSTTFRVLQCFVFGPDFARTCDIAALTQRLGSGHSESVAALRGKRLVIKNELGAGVSLSDERLKQLASSDVLVASRKGGHEFEFRRSFVLNIMTNTPPHIQNVDYGVWRRILVYPWTERITPDDPAWKSDDELDRMFESEASGIFNWCLSGAAMFIRAGRSIPQSEQMTKFMEEYRVDIDPFRAWWQDCVAVTNNPSDRVKCSEMVESYIRWHEQNEGPIKSRRAIARRLHTWIRQNVPGRQESKSSYPYRTIIDGYKYVVGVVVSFPTAPTWKQWNEF